MKQPEDTATIELDLAVGIEQPKRGRGRPAKADALTPAARAKRYRDAKRRARLDARAMHTTTGIQEMDSTAPEQDLVLTAQLKQAQAEIQELRETLLVALAERVTAYHACEQLAATLAAREDELQKARADLATTRADNATLAAQSSELNDFVQKLESRLIKHDVTSE